jgi:hypothetical protein
VAAIRCEKLRESESIGSAENLKKLFSGSLESLACVTRISEAFLLHFCGKQESAVCFPCLILSIIMTYEDFISPQKEFASENGQTPSPKTLHRFPDIPPARESPPRGPGDGRVVGDGWELAMYNQAHRAPSVVGRIIYLNDIKTAKFANIRGQTPAVRTTVPFVEFL